MRMSVCTVFILAVSCLLASTARAETETESESEAATRSYAIQTLTVDGVGLGLFVGAALTDGPGGRDTGLSNALLAGAFPTLLLGSPITHAVHGHYGKATGSLAMRLGLGFIGMVTGFAAYEGCDGIACEADGMAYGMLGGLALASVIDAATLANEKVDVEAAPVSPSVGVTRGGATVGLGGAW